MGAKIRGLNSVSGVKLHQFEIIYPKRGRGRCVRTPRTHLAYWPECLFFIVDLFTCCSMCMFEMYVKENAGNTQANLHYSTAFLEIPVPTGGSGKPKSCFCLLVCHTVWKNLLGKLSRCTWVTYVCVCYQMRSVSMPNALIEEIKTRNQSSNWVSPTLKLA